MAKYTETFAEYLDGGGIIPSTEFAKITGFEDLFKERFCGCEIGFETEELFALKLDMKAKLVMGVYADMLAVYLSQISELKTNPVRVRYETRDYAKQHSENETNGDNTDLPYNAETSHPTALSHLKGSADVDAHKDELTFKDGVSIDERLRLIDAMNRKARLVVEQCLEEFKPLFMGVY